MKLPPASATAVVSSIVLVAFSAVAVLTMTRAVPDTPAANSMLATLGTLATTVVAYWVGSSAGSAAKTALLAGASPPAAQPPAQPAAPAA